jgi:hypothetical protein
MENESGMNNTALALLVVVLAVMFAVSGFTIISIMEKLGPGIPYMNMEYTVSGTCAVDSQPFEFTGEGESEYVSETEEFRTFVFTFRQTSPEGDFKTTAKLICDAEGVPADLYAPEGESDGIGYWSSDEGGTHYRFGIKGDLVVSVEITAADFQLRADLVE